MIKKIFFFLYFLCMWLLIAYLFLILLLLFYSDSSDLVDLWDEITEEPKDNSNQSPSFPNTISLLTLPNTIVSESSPRSTEPSHRNAQKCRGKHHLFPSKLYSRVPQHRVYSLLCKIHLKRGNPRHPPYIGRQGLVRQKEYSRR